ncbi:bacillithiol biosynthesis cysteine-adding enzyme BshC [Planococcus lenghuensis]|uniref:Putative cysteine ligase BshC n=1 Tax=Planococcus lenghuensis TaxID=2213202 RepID=A0A1Q2L1P2_9BACL|nr:bacillithiol biosynthesis cysteine-adding enzyme BshC [Planococcus lenghuensis]AQQ53802.1 bacillithiol biosynthesis cysteine-adding enzyme BshC [Planococcus lenghuensis]
MELFEPFIAPASGLMNDYIMHDRKLLKYFEYKPEISSLKNRYERTVSRHPADRPRLARIIGSYMERFGDSPAAREALEHFSEGAPLVVTGQQAGLFTGPLYTVHKAISAIVLADKASAELDRIVVPLFWVAGEDHDIAEIAHVYRQTDRRVDKMNFPHMEYGKRSASAARLNKQKIGSHMEAYFKSLPETEHSKELFETIRQLFDRANTFTDFFSAFLHWLFKDSGLLFIDAADPALRAYEAEFFAVLIDRSAEIAEAVCSTEQTLRQDGYPTSLDANPESANLFLAVGSERMLLERDGDRFVCGNKIYTKEELLQLLADNPELFSNNVVTRPLMQDMVFPVLSYIGGPGEIAYWAELKSAFEVMGLEMPVVMPRLNMTLVSRRVGFLLEKHSMEPAAAIGHNEAGNRREELLEAARETEAEQLLASLEQELTSRYEDVREKFSSVSKGLLPAVDKNLSIHLDQLTYLKRKLQEEVELQHDVQLSQFRTIEQELLPDGNPQERIYSPVPYLNQYGPDLIGDMLKMPFNYDRNHKIICL